MSVRVERVDLPGIGVRNDVITEGGRRVSVVSLRSGERDLALFDADDPDASTDSIALTDDEAAALAEVLGASLSLSRVTGLGTREMGLFTEEMTLPTGSGWVGKADGRHQGAHADQFIDRGDRSRHSSDRIPRRQSFSSRVT